MRTLPTIWAEVSIKKGYDIDYCKINKINKGINVDYSHGISKKMQAGQDTTYNHIGHFNSPSGDIESTYNHVGDEMLKNTNCSTRTRTSVQWQTLHPDS